MAKKSEKKVSVADLEKVVKAISTEEVGSFDWNGLEVKYRKSIPMLDMVQFVDNVVDGCFGEDGTYHPEFKNFLFNSYMVSSYTNIRLPQNIERQYVIFTESDLADAVFARINHRQYEAMAEAVDEKIQYICDADIQATKQNMTSLLDQFNHIGEQLTKAFDGVSGTEIIQLIAAMNAGGLDENKIVEAFLEHQGQEDSGAADSVSEDAKDGDEEDGKIIMIERDDEV